MLAGKRSAGLRLEGETRLPGMCETREQVTDIGPLRAGLRVADHFAVEQHDDRGRRWADRPAAKREPAGEALAWPLPALQLAAVGVSHEAASARQPVVLEN